MSLDELLLEDRKSRICQAVPLPYAKPMRTEMVFKENKVNWQTVIRFLKRQGRISRQDFVKMITMATKIFKNEPNMVCLEDPVTVVGDIHGQFFDLCRILEQDAGGEPNQNDNKYLFLGDYVDRGEFSIEVLILLISLKLTYPKGVVLLRGNHECRQLTTHYNFRIQCIKKYDQAIYDLIMEMFDTMPLACLINKVILCVHGGISHQIQELKNISQINRFREITKKGIFCDLVWADPFPSNISEGEDGIKANFNRNCSYFFGPKITNKFMAKNKLVAIIRAHQVQKEGYQQYSWNQHTVISIFSAPNYCNYYDNLGAVIKFAKNMYDVKNYHQSPKPCLLPNFMDAISWTIPLMIKSIGQMYYHLIKPDGKHKTQDVPMELMFKLKIIEALFQYNEKFNKQSKQNMELLQLDGCPDPNLRQTMLNSNKKELSFDEKKKADKINQSRPKLSQFQSQEQ